MTSLIDFILALFRDEESGRAFVADPSRALADAGLSHVSPEQLSSVASTVAPQVALTGGDPLSGLRQAVAESHGADVFTSAVAPTNSVFSDISSGIPSNSLFSDIPIDIPIDTEASHNDTEVHDNTTQLGSHNATPIASPEFNFGDFVLGDQNSASGDGAVAISGSSSGDIVSGEGAMLGDGNEVYNGDLVTGSNSNIAYGPGSSVIQTNADVHEDVDRALDHTVAAEPAFDHPLPIDSVSPQIEPDPVFTTSVEHDATPAPIDDGGGADSTWNPPPLDFI